MFSAGVPKVKLSKYFHETCVRIGECKSREEEEEIVAEWLKLVKTKLGKSKHTISELYENVVSLIHLTLLGYNTEFGQIHAVNLTQDNQMMTKALGYIACSTLFDSKNQLLILLINSTQRDLQSNSPIAMILALNAICHLVTAELIPPVINFVGQALQHPIPIVRQKAIMCIHAFVKRDPTSVIDFFPELLRLLSDPDLSITNSLINTFLELIEAKINIHQIVESIPEFINVLNRIQTGQVHHEYTHQRVMAPFILTNLYRLFTRIAPHMPEISAQLTPLLTFTLQNTTTEVSASSSILYEAIKCAIALNLTNIPQLRGAISLFIGSPDTNSKFIGLGLLIKLPDFADEFQSTIIDCLEHPDSTIRLRTLALLHAMANESNAQIIVLNMLRFFQRTRSERVRADLADRITSIASRFSPSPLWFAKTMEQLFALGGDRVRPEIAHQVIKLIEEECDEEMRRSIVNLYIDVALSGRRLSDVFVTVIACIIGRYGNISGEYDLDYIALLLCDLADAYQGPRDWVLNALLQIVSQLEVDVPQQVISEFQSYRQSRSIIVQEICYEALALLNYRDALKTALADPEDEIEFDEGLSFLDTLVQESVAKGLPQYEPLEERDNAPLDLNVKDSLKYQPYQVQRAEYSNEGITSPEDNMNEPGQEEAVDNGLDTSGVRSVWTSDGYTAELDAEDQQHGLYEDTAIEQDSNKQAGATAGAQTAYGTSVLGGGANLFQQLQLKKKPTTQVSEKEKTKNRLFGKKPTPAAPATPPPTTSAPPPASPGAPYSNATPQSPMANNLNTLNNANPVPTFSNEEIEAALQKATQGLQEEPAEQIIKMMDATEMNQLYQDQRIVVTGAIQGGCVLIGVRNMSQSPIIQTQINLRGPQQLLKEEISFPKELGAIPQGETVLKLVTFKFPNKLPQWPDMNSFGLQVVIDGVPSNVDLNMNLLSFVLPLQGTTQVFGQLWKSGGCEIIYTLVPGSLTLDDICDGLRQECHMKTVQRIGSEEIFLGGLFSTPFKILMHVKFNPQRTEIKVLTKAPPLTQALVNELKNIFG